MNSFLVTYLLIDFPDSQLPMGVSWGYFSDVRDGGIDWWRGGRAVNFVA